jgi:hypothetical protein
MTAAAAAVLSYIKTEEEALALGLAMAEAPEDAAQAPAPEAPARAWSASGRQAHMQMRGMMQMKAFHGWSAR